MEQSGAYCLRPVCQSQTSYLLLLIYRRDSFHIWNAYSTDQTFSDGINIRHLVTMIFCKLGLQRQYIYNISRNKSCVVSCTNYLQRCLFVPTTVYFWKNHIILVFPKTFKWGVFHPQNYLKMWMSPLHF